MKKEQKHDITGALQKTLGIKNVSAVPRLHKVVINVGMGTFLKASKDYDEIVENIQKITGQKPIVTKAKKAISNFKLRIGMAIGVKVTLRGKRMHDFVDKLVKIVFPRIRDFRGLSTKAFDAKGNYTAGLREIIVFPEVNPDNLNKLHGLEITIVTTAKNNEECRALLTEIGFPFKKEESSK